MRYLHHSLILVVLIGVAGCASPPPPRDYTLDRSQLCEVHHIKMTKTIVPISYGLPNKKAADRYIASTNSFPNYASVGGGCMVTKHSPREAFVFVCPECEQARQKWEIEYDKKQ